MTVPDTKEEAAAKLPALHVMMAMGWEYLAPAQALAMRGSERAVLFTDVLRDRLTSHRFDFKGQRHPLSPAAIAAVIRPAPQRISRRTCAQISGPSASNGIFLS